jgi:hypothetical protein
VRYLRDVTVLTRFDMQRSSFDQPITAGMPPNQVVQIGSREGVAEARLVKVPIGGQVIRSHDEARTPSANARRQRRMTEVKQT